MFNLGLSLFKLWNRKISNFVIQGIIKFDKRPFSKFNEFKYAELKKHIRDLQASGIRIFPYPFGTALSVISDIDGSKRLDYAGYTSLLVDEMGLDFGDSFRLHHRSPGPGSKDCAFFSCEGSGPPACDQQRNTADCLGFYELLREYHLGNLDHFHAFGGMGQRCIWLTDMKKQSNGCFRVSMPAEIEKTRGGSQSFIANFIPILVIVVLPVKGKKLPEGTEVSITLKDKKNHPVRYTAFSWKADNGMPRFSSSLMEPAFFSIVEGRESTIPPVIEEIEEIVIKQPPDCNHVEVSAVCALNTYGRHILRMLTRLKDEFNVMTNTLTDHSSQLFVNKVTEKKHSVQNARRAHEKPLPALYSSVKKRKLYYSCLGDDPESPSYVLPDLMRRFGIRFINPGGTSGEKIEWVHLLNVIVPAMTRDGSKVYVGRRIAVDLPDSHPLFRDMGTRSFTLRLDRLLDSHANYTSAVWPFYTHLGNIKPKKERQNPYFSKDIVSKLQNRVFNIKGEVKPDRRVWFARASVFYDYALIVRSISRHVKREGDNIIYIESWHDTVINKRLPLSQNQLHGITFYVQKSSEAKVFLDGEEIVDLLRNPADETGKDSITIIGAGARHIVLDDYNFIKHQREDIDPGLEYTWKDDAQRAFRGNAYAEITLKSSGTKTLAYYPKDLKPAGTQYFVYAIRKSSERMKAGILVETESGGLFYFGDEIELDQKYTAGYFSREGRPGDWQLRITPFYDLDWAADARPGGPLPSHPTRAIYFLVSGEAGEHVSFDRVEFIRPATTADLHHKKGYVVGGQVINPEQDMKVTLSYGEGSNRITRTEPLTDARGYFAFSGIPEGSVVKILAECNDKTLIPTRGSSFDVWGNDMNLTIENKKPGGSSLLYD